MVFSGFSSHENFGLYGSFDKSFSNQIGGWSTEGLTVDRNCSNGTSITCLTTHLTSFAVLVSIQDKEQPVRRTTAVVAYYVTL